MVVNPADLNIRFFSHFTADCVLKALAGFDEAGNCRITVLRPAPLASKKAVLAMRHKNDDCRIDARKKLGRTFLITANSGVTTRLDERQRATNTAMPLQSVPEHEGPGVGNEIRLVNRQHTAEVAKVMKLTHIGKRCVEVSIDADGERRLSLVHTKEYRLLRFQKFGDVDPASMSL